MNWSKIEWILCTISVCFLILKVKQGRRSNNIYNNKVAQYWGWQVYYERPSLSTGWNCPLLLNNIQSVLQTSHCYLNTVGARIPNIRNTNPFEIQTFFLFCFRMLKNKMAAILFRFWMVRTIRKPNFGSKLGRFI